MDKVKNHLSIRIQRSDVLDMMDALCAKNGAYKSKNELINRALELAIPELYNAYFAKKVAPITMPSQSEVPKTLAKDVAALKNMLSQQSIELNMIEYLCAFLYNVVAAKAEGIEITKEFIESGVFEQLPANLEEVKREMTQMEYRRRSKQDNA